MGRTSILLRALAFVVFIATSAVAQTYADLYDFDGVHGVTPTGILAQGEDGNLYGTAGGGAGRKAGGVIFRITPDGSLDVVHTFHQNSTDGFAPSGGLTLGTDGKLYGTTQAGGTGDVGTVFKGSPYGGTVLHSFAEGTDGFSPYSPPVEDAEGNFYGTPSLGNAYQITASGTFTSLNPMPGVSYSPLLQASDGNLYGTTYGGGANYCVTSTCGTIFSMTHLGRVTVVHSFDKTHGYGPEAGVIEGDDGNLYGTTQWGSAYGCACNDGNGVVFKLTSNGEFTVLHNFGDPNYPNDGMGAVGMIQATDGNFYGLTIAGGTSTNCQFGCGTIFEISSSGVYSILYDFDETLGSFPKYIVQHTNGEIYGLAAEGGALGKGTVYSLDLGLPPFVRSVISLGRVGQTGGILGQGFTGTTSVMFNGTAASFKVVSDTYLTAAVPLGATSGYITVTTPSGALKSNTPFTVLP